MRRDIGEPPPCSRIRTLPARARDCPAGLSATVSSILTHSCPRCSRSLDSERSLRVHHWRSHGETLPKWECAHCGNRFDSEYERKYCSEGCREAAVSRSGDDNPNYSGAQKQAKCSECGELFEYYPSDKRGVYCPGCVSEGGWQHRPDVEGEDNPRWNGGKNTYRCELCGEAVERHPSATSGVVVCSEECRREWLSIAFTGDGHPNWKGGGNLEYGEGWNEVRDGALERDGYECRYCGAGPGEIGRNPDVHHLVPVRWFVDSEDYSRTDAHFLPNVVTLCPSCHRKAEFGTIDEFNPREPGNSDGPS